MFHLQSIKINQRLLNIVTRLKRMSISATFLTPYRHAGQEIRKMHVIRTIEKLRLNPLSILDAGSGNGDYVFQITKMFPNAKVCGVECDSEKIQLCEKKNQPLSQGNVNFINEDITKTLGVDEYDLVCCIDVLEHIEDDNKSLRNMFRALKWDGKLLIHVPLKEDHIFWKVKNLHKQDNHVRDGYDVDEILDKLERNGFLINQKRYTFNKFKGALAWEIWKVSLEFNLLVQLAFRPLVTFLGWLDDKWTNTSGGGILVIAEKKKYNL